MLDSNQQGFYTRHASNVLQYHSGNLPSHGAPGWNRTTVAVASDLQSPCTPCTSNALWTWGHRSPVRTPFTSRVYIACPVSATDSVVTTLHIVVWVGPKPTELGSVRPPPVRSDDASSATTNILRADTYARRRRELRVRVRKGMEWPLQVSFCDHLYVASVAMHALCPMPSKPCRPVGIERIELSFFAYQASLLPLKYIPVTLERIELSLYG